MQLNNDYLEVYPMTVLRLKVDTMSEGNSPKFGPCKSITLCIVRCNYSFIIYRFSVILGHFRD